MNIFCKTTQMTSFPHLHFFFFLIINIALCLFPCRGCHEEERMALLDIKSNVVDPSGRLSSWQESIQHKNCCSWQGIECSSESLHVISIDLRNKDLEMYQYRTPSTQLPPDTALQGKLSPQIFNLTRLEYLDLGFNDFQGSEITHRFSYLTKLTHLDLSLSNFSASISTQFSNLTFLQYLDLSCFLPSDITTGSPYTYSTPCLRSSSTRWVKGLVNLQVLRLRGVGLFEVTSSKNKFGEHISYLWNLRELDISDCEMHDPIHQFHNLSHLSTLKMNNNNYLNSSIPLQLANLTSLSILELSWCGLQGSIPYLPKVEELDVSLNHDLHPDLTRMFKYPWPRLQKLQISYTKVTGSIPSSISNAPRLVSLTATNCEIQGSLPASIYNLSRLQHLDLSYNNIKSSIHSSVSNLKYLNYLDLSVNKFQGPIPESICEIFPLRYLYLWFNNITGTIPGCISKLRNLSVLYISRNSIGGKVSLISLINELNLTILELSSNNLTVVIDQHPQPSKFKLVHLDLGSCKLNGFIPTIICNFKHLNYLDLSDNNLTGAIPSCIYKLKTFYALYLSKNRLRGPLPLLPHSLEILDLSRNELSDEISLKTRESLSSDSQLSGVIPASIGHCTSLRYLNLGNNNLTGNVPNELQNAEGLEYLELNDNNLNGPCPMFIVKLLFLEVLNLGNNNFEGNIPTGLGSLNHLKILSLRSNKFNGSIPKEIFHLQHLQILDLSSNNFSGTIPSKLGNLTSLANGIWLRYDRYSAQYKLAIKGTTSQFGENTIFNSGIDLSCNILNGTIPEDIGLLTELRMLNLSHNLFSSNIPTSLGNMSSLESLDLSSNRLSGQIPQNLTSIDSLEILNLSHNNLSGRIPRGSHFDTLSVDGYAFAGNDLLCGYPSEKVCDGDHYIDTSPSSEVDEDDQENRKEKFLLYAIVAMGFAVGFWGFFFILLLKKQKWWFPYWRTVDSVAVRLIECIRNKQQ
ncbi:hypothetical protein MKW92_052337 [Papaver armeniacum]|nr:hypothetical protein MKW92_052337 [Papaver armeniacum]